MQPHEEDPISKAWALLGSGLALLALLIVCSTAPDALLALTN